MTNPVLKFLVILLIILFAPIILNKIKIPHILGLIIAGVIVGPNGFNLLLLDSGIILSGTTGLLYIMFLAGLELDLAEFKKKSAKSVLFGLYTFIIPMVLGTAAGLFVLNFSVSTSILLASMFASHTLITYPIVSKLGVTKNKAVNIAVGGTIITDTLALLVLAVIIGMTAGEVNSAFWTKLTVSIIVFGLIILVLFPIFGRWFFKHFEDHVSQYIFVLVMVFLGAFLAEAAGVEAIIGAFLSGLALNRLIPPTSPLMNRIEFVGNAIFIPLFLIGVGMLVDYRAFFTDLETIKVAAVMTIIATSAKYLAALLAQKTFKLSVDERRLVFGLSNAQAAATLAAVLVGYNIIIGESANGDPVRLLNDSVLNGTIIMILITCTIATFVTQKGARNIVISENTDLEMDTKEMHEKILISIGNPEHTEEFMNLSAIIKSKHNRDSLFALNVIINTNEDFLLENNARKQLEKAVKIGASTDTHVHKLLRYDLNISNGIANVIREHRITDLVIGPHHKTGLTDDFIGALTKDVLEKCNATIFIYKAGQPIATVKRTIIIIPDNAEKESGFSSWLVRVWNIGRNTGSKLVFYASEDILKIIRNVHSKHPVEAEFNILNEWGDILIISKQIKKDDNVIIVMSRENRVSYHNGMERIPSYINNYFIDTNYLLIYPVQNGIAETTGIDYRNPSLFEPMKDNFGMLDKIGEKVIRLFVKKR